MRRLPETCARDKVEERGDAILRDLLVYLCTGKRTRLCISRREQDEFFFDRRDQEKIAVSRCANSKKLREREMCKSVPGPHSFVRLIIVVSEMGRKRKLEWGRGGFLYLVMGVVDIVWDGQDWG